MTKKMRPQNKFYNSQQESALVPIASKIHILLNIANNLTGNEIRTKFEF